MLNGGGDDGGVTNRVALVSCVKTKGVSSAPAEDLYTSPLFRALRAYAKTHAGEWYVLSAKHGVLRPEQVIAPYEQTLNAMPKRKRVAWGVPRPPNASFLLVDIEPVSPREPGEIGKPAGEKHGPPMKSQRPHLVPGGVSRADDAECDDQCDRERPVGCVDSEPRCRRADCADVKARGAVTLRAQRRRGLLTAQPEVANPVSVESVVSHLEPSSAAPTPGCPPPARSPPRSRARS
ncbi:MAG: DUF6884 domain-containing protein [Gemmatimonadaceae bacterium]